MSDQPVRPDDAPESELDRELDTEAHRLPIVMGLQALAAQADGPGGPAGADEDLPPITRRFPRMKGEAWPDPALADPESPGEASGPLLGLDPLPQTPG